MYRVEPRQACTRQANHRSRGRGHQHASREPAASTPKPARIPRATSLLHEAATHAAAALHVAASWRASAASAGSSPRRRAQKPAAEHDHQSSSTQRRRASDAPIKRAPQRRRRLDRGSATCLKAEEKAATSASEQLARRQIGLDPVPRYACSFQQRARQHDVPVWDACRMVHAALLNLRDLPSIIPNHPTHAQR